MVLYTALEQDYYTGTCVAFRGQQLHMRTLKKVNFLLPECARPGDHEKAIRNVNKDFGFVTFADLDVVELLLSGQYDDLQLP